MKPKIVFVNDTSTFNNHFGCQLVGQTFREQFARVGFDLILTLGLEFNLTKEIQVKLNEADLIIINGEGCIHHGKNHHLIELSKKFPCALINCVFEQNPDVKSLEDFLFVATRESYSKREVNKIRSQCEVVPDVIFASSYLNSFLPKKPTEDVGVTDSVRNTKIGFGPKPKLIREYLVSLTKYKRLCIGRFHAVIAAIVLERPFSSWDSNTHKTKALMEDIGIPHLHFKTYNEAFDNIPTEFPNEAIIFKKNAVIKIEAMFDALYKIAINNRKYK